MRGGFAFAALLAALPALAAAPPGKAPLTIADMHRLATIAEPRFSPDGAQIVYSVAKDDVAGDAITSDLWVVPWSGGAAHALTDTPDSSEWQPEYSRDGRWIAYLGDATADKNEDADTQLWLMPAAGGTGRRVSHIPGGISDFSLSPDGRQAVVVARVGSLVGNTAKVPPPIVIDRFFFKADGEGYLGDGVQHLFLVDLASGAARQVTSGARDHWHPVWSPDGRSIAFTGKDLAERDRTLDYNIYVMPAAGGEAKRISPLDGLDNDPDWGARPSWSPDSRRIVWLEGEASKWIYYGTPQLAVADVLTGQVTRPARIDRWFYYPRWSDDGKSLLALVEQDRTMWLARVDPGSGALTYLSQGDRFASDFAVGAGGRIALLDGDATAPPELRAIGGGVLTHQNDWLKDRAIAAVRDIAFASGDTEIYGLVVTPPDHVPGRRYPVILDLHGGPVYQFSHEFDLDQQLYAAAGYVVVAINPRGSSGRGSAFARAIYADWGNSDVKDISAGIDKIIADGIADPDRIGVGGWSYGGILTDYMIASDRRIKAAISGAGAGNPIGTYGIDMYAREYELELGTPWAQFETWTKLAYPFLHPERITAATMFQCAGEDDNVPCAGAQQMYMALKSTGVPTRLVVYPQANHDLGVPSYRIDRMTRNIAWYDTWLKR